MKLKKAPGIDNISSEVLKAGVEAMVTMLHNISTKAINHKRTPKDWSKMVISPIYKKVKNLTHPTTEQ